MARTPTYPLGLPDEQRARWEAEAERRGLSLAEFVRRAVERDIALGPPGFDPFAAGERPARVPGDLSGKFRGPDPKVKPRPKG